jgi:cellulose biosynthesis protein BcsQ
MLVIAFSSPKGGAGKTTAAALLATVLAGRTVRVKITRKNPEEVAYRTDF